jgi:DNA-binding HxlR family transcriptional regulator
VPGRETKINARGRVAVPECGLSVALAVVSGKWKAAILWELHERPVRFLELRRRLPGISEKVLFEQLRELEESGIARREVFEEARARVEYSLTPEGAALNETLHALGEWGLRYSRGRAAVRRADPVASD